MPNIESVLHFLTELQQKGQSWSALRARQHEGALVRAIAVVATAWAVGIFLVSLAAPGKPLARHDTILKARLSSPAPSQDIVIIDVDERSLAALAADHGRWPWPREVMADALQKLADAGARSVVFNVMMSDPDKKNPDGDAALEAAAQMVRPVVFPLIRLNPENDRLSALPVSALPGARIPGGGASGPTVAAIIPYFQTMHDRLGVANQRPEDDGIVRTYPLRWNDQGWSLPSIVEGAVVHAGIDTDKLPDTLNLNWRNKEGRYRRFSFADFFRAPAEAPLIEKLRGAVVVLGVSAPGVGQTRPTGVSQLEDDNEILATALDDAINDTHIRVVPDFAVLLISIAGIWAVAFCFMFRISSKVINILFFLLQSALGSVTLISISYTKYLVDLTEPFSFILAVFSVIKFTGLLSRKWVRAKPGYRKTENAPPGGGILIIGFHEDKIPEGHLQKWLRTLEASIGHPNVIVIDDLFSPDSFLGQTLSRLAFLVISVAPDKMDAVQNVLSEVTEHGGAVTRVSPGVPWNPNDKSCAAALTPLFVENCQMVLQGQPSSAEGSVSG
jgi:CHASE2 domain-containing sensor protein